MENPKETSDIRTLLQEARADLVWISGAYSDEKSMVENASAAYEMSCTAKERIRVIDSAFAAPEPGAMEIVRKVRDKSPQNICEKCGGTWEMHDETLKCNGRLSSWKARFDYDISDIEAAALIEQYGRRVPRAMLVDIWHKSYSVQLGVSLSIPNEAINDIAARYDVRIEGDK